MDRVLPSEGRGCQFEPGREHDTSAEDAAALRRSIVLGDLAASHGDVPVGAILVTDGRAFEAHNTKEADQDPTAHAEMLAIRDAAAALGRWRVGGTLYVTKEPCAMCAGAIVAARIERLVYGCDDPKGGASGTVIDIFASAAVNHRVEVVRGVLADETAAQLRAFFAQRRA